MTSVRILFVAAVLCLLTAGAVSAQFSDQAELTPTGTGGAGLGVKPAESPFSLINLANVKWSHSYSVSYFSGGTHSGSAGLWTSSMLYEISPKLSLGLNFGILHNAGVLWGDGNSNATFLPGLRLDYHPSDKFHMSVIVQKVAGWYGPDDYLRNYFWQPTTPY
jgi:hypothetical protein